MAGVNGQNLNNKNAEGNKGGNGAPTVQDRELSKEVRRLTLEEIKKVLLKPKEDYELFKALLTRLAGTVLPRLNEHAGPDGKPIPIMNVK